MKPIIQRYRPAFVRDTIDAALKDSTPSTFATRDWARWEAKGLRKKLYIGSPCKRGHTLRYVINGGCVECQRDSRRRTRQKAKRT